MKEYLLTKDNTYIIGVSGGVDSMALLDMLRNKGYNMVVCHVNYHLRHDSNIDQRIVENYCSKYKIPCYSKEVRETEYGRENFQMQARNIRYDFYKEIATSYDAEAVVLGHHEDDVIETIYIQIQRGNTKGFLGIQERSVVKDMDIIRPLLSMKKEVLYTYCKDNKIVYHEDYTNFETKFTRDYIRNVALPKYSETQKKELLVKAEIHNLEVEKRQLHSMPIFQQYKKEDKITYPTINDEYMEDIVYLMIKEYVYPPYISNTLIEEVCKQIRSNKPNIIVDLPLNTVFIKEYDNIYVSKKDISNSYCLKYNKLVYDKHDYFYLSDTGHINEGIYVKDTDLPLTIRTLKEGDTIETSGGTKKVSRLFINCKIPKRERKIWPIVVRADGTIILVPNIAKNIGYLYTKPNVFVIKYKDLGSE